MKKRTALSLAVVAAVLASATTASAGPPRKTYPLYLRYICETIRLACPG